MIYFVTAKDILTAKKVTHDLQAKNLADCFISPLTAIPCLGDINIPNEDKNAVRLDLLTVCDGLIAKKPVTSEMQREIDLARLIKMEVQLID